MSYHRYPRKALLADYARSAAGVAVAGVPLVAADLSLVPGLLVGSLVLLFLIYGLRTALRQLRVVDVSEIGIRELGPLGGAIPWDELRQVQLKYYSTRRDSKSGWLQLKLVLIAGLVIYHVYCGVYLVAFRDDRNRHGHVFYRWFNEVPVLFLIAVVLLATLKPF